jgi:isoquinoline 1-oxidoreductase
LSAEAAEWKGAQVKMIHHSNFDSYDTRRFSWVPAMGTIPGDNPDLTPQDCGEPAVACMGRMMANALFDAVGVRHKQLPLTAECVKAALAG